MERETLFGLDPIFLGFVIALLLLWVIDHLRGK
jgi:hypothetical protein